MFEEFRRDVIFTNIGCQYEIETSTCIISVGYVFVVCQPEAVFPTELALFSCNVFVAFEESRSENVSRCFR